MIIPPGHRDVQNPSDGDPSLPLGSVHKRCGCSCWRRSALDWARRQCRSHWGRPRGWDRPAGPLLRILSKLFENFLRDEGRVKFDPMNILLLTAFDNSLTFQLCYSQPVKSLQCFSWRLKGGRHKDTLAWPLKVTLLSPSLMGPLTCTRHRQTCTRAGVNICSKISETVFLPI